MSDVILPTTEVSAERQAILFELGDVLGQHINQEFAPKTPFFTELKTHLEAFHFYHLNEETGRVGRAKWGAIREATEASLVYNVWHVMHDSALASKWGHVIYDKNNRVVTGPESQRYAALSHARKVLARSDDPIDRLQAVIIPAITAMEYKPENWHPDQKIAKHKNMTNEEQIFRIAWRDLAYIYNGTRQKTYAMNSYIGYIKGLHKKYPQQEAYDLAFKALRIPENEILRQGELSLGIKNLAGNLKKLIERPELTAASFAEEMLMLQKIRHNQDQQQEIPTEETNWTILPPGTLEELSEEDGSSSEVTKNFVDPERMKWLARLAMQWGAGAYIAVGNLDSTGSYNYRVAVLPEEKDGVVTEHAIAENPSSGNAIYVFRGERGLEEDGGHWLTWRQVLSDTKGGARTLGARRILHGDNCNENVMEYLTRPTADLDKPGYKR